VDILISGAGVAGPTAAYWLSCYGENVTMVERAPALRTGGYIIDFWGAGYDVAERMGLMPQMSTKGYHVREVRFVGENGRRVGGFGVASLSRMLHERFISLPRGDLAAAIFAKAGGAVETIFGDEIVGLDMRK
jgi:2-polyprenyl-6-methoxyphenol hydroxylase-like FAD-dependent oxidoreductase